MKNEPCKSCETKTAFAIRVVQDKGIKLVCSNCGRTWKNIPWVKKNI